MTKTITVITLHIRAVATNMICLAANKTSVVIQHHVHHRAWEGTCNLVCHVELPHQFIDLWVWGSFSYTFAVILCASWRTLTKCTWWQCNCWSYTSWHLFWNDVHRLPVSHCPSVWFPYNTVCRCVMFTLQSFRWSVSLMLCQYFPAWNASWKSMWVRLCDLASARHA